jgi:hypothetical protein
VTDTLYPGDDTTSDGVGHLSRLSSEPRLPAVVKSLGKSAGYNALSGYAGLSWSRPQTPSDAVVVPSA